MPLASSQTTVPVVVDDAPDPPLARLWSANARVASDPPVTPMGAG